MKSLAFECCGILHGAAFTAFPNQDNFGPESPEATCALPSYLLPFTFFLSPSPYHRLQAEVNINRGRL